MAYKKSVRITNEAAGILAAFSEGDEMNWSGSINSMAEQVGFMVAEIKLKLTKQEWSALHCCYNGYISHPNPVEESRLLPWHVDQGYRYDEQVRSFLGSEDAAMALVEKLEKMSLSERMMVVVAAKSFWRKGPGA